MTCAILTFFLRQNYLLLIRYAGLEPELATLLNRELKFLVITIFGTFSVFLLVITILGVNFSQRVGGALYAVKRTMRDIIDGKKATLMLRKRDEFQDLADSFNQLVRKLEN